MLRDYRWSLTFVLVLLIAYTAFILLIKKPSHPIGHEPASTSAALPNPTSATATTH